jgi:hypothetical protein
VDNWVAGVELSLDLAVQNGYHLILKCQSY